VQVWFKLSKVFQMFLSRVVDFLESIDTDAQRFLISVGHGDVLEELWDEAPPVTRRQTSDEIPRQRQTSQHHRQSRSRAQGGGPRQMAHSRQVSSSSRGGCMREASRSISEDPPSSWSRASDRNSQTLPNGKHCESARPRHFKSTDSSSPTSRSAQEIRDQSGDVCVKSRRIRL